MSVDAVSISSLAVESLKQEFLSVLLGPKGQFSSVTQSCLTLCDSMNCSMPGLPVHHQLPEFTQTHVHWVGSRARETAPFPGQFWGRRAPRW